MIPTAGPVTGWFGKLPARGDFVGHGLPADWVGPWDACLQQMLRLAEAQGLRRLRFAPWRFLAWPQGAGGAAWAGVLVPSQDRVGRAFPLTVAQRLQPCGAGPGLDGPQVEAALARLADAALDVTDPADPVLMADFVAVLSAVAPPDGDVRPDAAWLAPAGGAGACSAWWPPPVPGMAPRPCPAAWPPEPARLLTWVSRGTDPVDPLGPDVAAPAPAPRTPS